MEKISNSPYYPFESYSVFYHLNHRSPKHKRHSQKNKIIHSVQTARIPVGNPGDDTFDETICFVCKHIERLAVECRYIL